MSIPGMDALSNPTTFSHSDRLPLDGIEQANGVTADFGDGFGIGGLTTLHDNSVDANSGPSAVNRPLTHTYLVNSAEHGPNAYHHEALCFVRRLRTVNFSLPASMQAEHQLVSLSYFNRWLRNNKDARVRYGSQKNTKLLREDWKFAGSVKRPGKNADTLMMTRHDDAVPVVFGGRARIADIGRGYNPVAGTRDRPSRGVPGQRDHLFFLFRRYRKSDDIEDELSAAGVGSGGGGGAPAAAKTPDAYYWQVEVYVNRTGQAPESCLYTDQNNTDPDDDYLGDYLHIGWIGFVYGTRQFSPDLVAAARSVIKGREDAKEALVSMPAVEVFIGTH